MKCFAVTTTMLNDKGGQIWFNFETPYAETMEEFWEVLSDRGSILGQRLRTNRDKTAIIGRTEMIIGNAGIVMVTPMHLALVDETSGE